MIVGRLEIEMAANLAQLTREVQQGKGVLTDFVAHCDRLAGLAKASLAGIASGLAAGLSIHAIKSFIENTVAATAALKQMSEVTGATIDGLSNIRAIAKLSGTDIGAVEIGLTKLAKGMSGADDETKGFGAALAQLGLSAKGSEGNLKATDAMLLDIALKLNQYADGAGKTAAAQALLGKSGAQLLPLLKDMADQAEVFGAKTQEEKDRLAEIAAQADEYEKNLKRLQTVKSALFKQIVNEGIPVMDSFVKALLGAKNESGGLKDKVNELAKDGTLKEWAKDIALGIAFVVDQFDLFYRIFQTVGKAIGGGIGIFQGLAEAIIATAEGMSGNWTGAAQRMQRSFLLVKESAIGAYQDIEKVWSKATFGDRLRKQLEDDAKAIAKAVPKPQLNFSGGNGTEKPANDDVLKRIDALKQLGLLEKAVYEADQAVFKAMLDQESADLRAALELRYISEKDFIDRESTLRLAAANAEAEKASLEADNAVDILARMYQEFDSIVGKNAEDAARLRTQAQAKIDEQSKAVVAALANEEKARIGVTRAENEWTVAIEKNTQKIFDQVRAVVDSYTDFQRQADQQIAAEQLEAQLIGATNVERQTALSMMEYQNKLTEARVAHERALFELRQREADQTQIDAENEKYAAITASLIKQRDAHLAIIPLIEAQQRQVENLKNAWQAIDGEAFRVFESIFDKGTDTWKMLADDLKKVMIRALYELTVQKWAVQIFANITGGIGGAIAGQASGGLLNTAGSLLSGASSAGTVGGWLGLGSSSTAATAGYTGAATFGGAGLAGGGSMIGGGAVGSATGLAAGEGSAIAASAAAEGAATAAGAAWVPVVGWVVAIAALAYAVFAASKEPSPAKGGLSFTGPYEDSVKPTHTAFGDIGFGDAQTQQFSGQVGKAFTDAIGSLLDTAAKQLNPETVTALTETLHQTVLQSAEGSFTTEDFLNTFGPGMAKQLLDPVLGAIDPYAQKLVDDFKGPLDKMLAFAGDILTVTGLIKDKGTELTALFGQAINLEALDAVRNEGESFDAEMGRLAQAFASTNQIANMMGKTQEQVWGVVGLASDKAREQLIQFAGGADKLTASLSSYYDHYFSESEKQARTQKELGDAFGALGETMPTTLAGFRALVEAQDLTTEAGRKEYAGLLALEGKFYDFVQATNKAGDAVGDLTGKIIDLHTNSLGGVPEALPGSGGIRLAPPLLGTELPANADDVAKALKTQTDLEKQLYDATHDANAVIANNRALRLQELALDEQAARLAPGTLTNTQKLIDAQIDLDAATKAVADAANAAGLSQSSLASAIAKGLQDGTGFQALGDTLVTGIETALRNQAADKIAAIFYDELVTPIFQQIVAGGAVADVLTQENIDAMVAKAQTIADGLATVFDDPKFTSAMDSLRESMSKLSVTAQEASAAVGTYSIPLTQTLNGKTYIFVGGVWVPADSQQAPGTSPEDILGQKLSLLAEIYALTGNKAGAAAVLEQQHAIALAKLDPSLRALQTELWSLQAAAEATAKTLEFTKAKQDLQIQILRATGHEADAVAIEHQQIIDQINAQWETGSDRANELIALYQQLWSVQGQSADATAGWIKQIQDWLRSVQLDQTLSPLTGQQRFDFAQQRYVEDLLKAQGGDSAAAARFTQDADAYLKEALAMFGRASGDFNAIFRATLEQGQGLVDQGLATSPATMTDLNATMQSGQQTAKQQMDTLIAKVSDLNSELTAVKQELQANTRTVEQQTVAIVDSTEEAAATTTSTLLNSSSGGLLAAH